MEDDDSKQGEGWITSFFHSERIAKHGETDSKTGSVSTKKIITREVTKERQEFNQLEHLGSLSPEDIEKRYNLINQDDLTTDITLKKKFAYYFFWVLGVQLAVMNAVFIFVGLGGLDFSDVALNIYMSGTLIEVFGIVLVMVKYLFSSKK
ncbi:hypothetical protein [Thorsellia kenyensis]|uniref:Cation-transporting P-type ATPase N-terminal domain-containing protein n=1 Tax=Thorsellia kenyensis TaxID=1549888 RepID=A0ABV6C7S4_9GAMM